MWVDNIKIKNEGQNGRDEGKKIEGKEKKR
jgi:hypothetical protein